MARKRSHEQDYDFSKVIAPFLDNIQNEVIKGYMQIRIVNLVNHYDTTSINNQQFFNRMNIWIIVLSALITVSPIPVFSDILIENKQDIFLKCLMLVPSILGAISTILLGIMQIRQYSRLYVESRLMCEFIKKETFIFLGQLSIKTDKAEIDRLFMKFVNNIEKAVLADCEEWKEAMQPKEIDKDKSEASGSSTQETYSYAYQTPTPKPTTETAESTTEN